MVAKEIIQRIKSSISSNNIALKVFRCTGKTSIMLEAARQLKSDQDFVTVYIDLNVFEPLNEENFLNWLHRQIVDAYLQHIGRWHRWVDTEIYSKYLRKFLSVIQLFLKKSKPYVYGIFR